MAGYLKFGLFFLIGLGALVPAWADSIAVADPTRPPGQMLTEGSDGAPEEGAQRLQSVLLPKGGRPLAVIGGKVVRLGEKVGEARLIRVNESEAVLSGPQGMEHLYLTPDVKKSTKVRKDAAVTGKKKE